MADQMEALIRLLVAEADYREGKGNRNKFSTDLGHPADAWCFDFLDWGAQKVGMTADQFPMSRWVPDAMTWGKKRGRFYRGTSSVRRGDLLLCGSDRPRHIELALSGVGKDGRIERVGGNTNANGSANGDGVYHDRYRRASTVYGTVRPVYGATGPAPAATPAVLDVTQTQASLAALGFAPGAADGVLGPATKAATAAYQADRGLTADGVPGPTTRQHLEADMTTLNEIAQKLDSIPRQVWGVGGGAAAPMIPRGEGDGTEYPLTGLSEVPRRTARLIAPLAGQVAGLTAAIEQLAKGQGIDLGAITAAAEKGAKAGAASVSADDVAAKLTVQAKQ